MVLQALRMIQDAFDVYSDEFQSIAEAIRSLRGPFGKADKADNVIPASVKQLAENSRQGKPFSAVPAAGLQSKAPPPTPQAAAPMPGGL